VTANDTLLIGTSGSIYRSTDKGDSWTATYTLTQSTIWSWTKKDTGSILAVERDGDEILQSTNDGQSWSSFATISNDFPRFTDHIHKVEYHPVNDWVIATGGDGDDVFYRYNGSTWHEFTAPYGQYLAIACRPTPTPDAVSGEIYFLGHDDTAMGSDSDRGIVLIRDDGTSELVVQQIVQTLNPEQMINTATGSMHMNTVHEASSGITYYLSATLNLDNNLLFASTGIDGRFWRAIAPINNSWRASTSSWTAYNQIDPGNVPVAVDGDRWVDLDTAKNPLYGSSYDTPVDTQGRQLRHELRGDRVDPIITTIRPDSEEPITLAKFRFEGDSKFNRLWYGYGGLIYRSGNNIALKQNDNGNLQVREGDIETWPDGSGVVVTTPDGTDDYRIRVDNSGNVVTDGPL